MTLTPAQAEARRTAIGASEAAAALGLSPHVTALQLYLAKTRGRPDAPSPAMRLGAVLEAPIAAHLANLRGVKLRRQAKTHRNRAAPFMVAHVDRRVQGDPATVIEIKTASTWASRAWDDGVPLHYRCQAHHILCCVPEAARVIFAGIIGGEWRDGYADESLVVHREQRNLDVITELEQKFWRLVEARTPPKATALADVRELWRAGGLGAKEADAGVAGDYEAYREMAEVAKAAGILADALKVRLLDWLGDSDEAVAGGARLFSNRRARDSKRQSPKGVVEALAGWRAQVVEWAESLPEEARRGMPRISDEEIAAANEVVVPGARRFLAGVGPPRGADGEEWARGVLGSLRGVEGHG